MSSSTSRATTGRHWASPFLVLVSCQTSLELRMRRMIELRTVTDHIFAWRTPSQYQVYMPNSSRGNVKTHG